MGGACQQLSVDGDARTPANDRDPAGLLQHDDTENQQQQQACWERFLLKETLNVLLVESDDSTRQIVSALIPCCMYQGLFIPIHPSVVFLRGYDFAYSLPIISHIAAYRYGHLILNHA